MKPEHLLILQLFGVLGAAYAVAAIVGRLLPRTGTAIALLAFLAVAVLWGLLAVEESGGPGAVIGMALAAVLSLILFSVGIGLIAGAQSNIEIGVGFFLGLMVAAIVDWKFVAASPIAGVCVLVSCCFGGYLLGIRRRRGLARAPS